MPYKNLKCKLSDWIALQRRDNREPAGGMCDYCGQHFAHEAEFTVHLELVRIDAERRTPPKPLLAP